MADWIEELKRLASLHEQGLLSDEEFEELKRGLLPNAPDEPEAETVEAVVDPEVQELRRLSSLHESGVLSDGEFAAEKARILGLSTGTEEELEVEPEEDELELESDSKREEDSRPGAIQDGPEGETAAGGKGRKSLAVLLLLAGIAVGAFFIISAGDSEDTSAENEVEESTEAADTSSESDQSDLNGSEPRIFIPCYHVAKVVDFRGFFSPATMWRQLQNLIKTI